MAAQASRYAQTYALAKTDPESFWLEAAKQIDWVSAPTRAFAADQGVYGRWFPDAVVNTCYNALDRHVASRGDQVAVVAALAGNVAEAPDGLRGVGRGGGWGMS